jgi:phosphonate transport system permease protein
MSTNRSITQLPESPSVRLSTWLLLGAMILLVIASFLGLRWKIQEFFTLDALRTTKEFLTGFAPPDFSSSFLKKGLQATLETLSMSALGTIIAGVVGLLLALPASGRAGATARAGVRSVLNVLRAVPELVWATILLITAGLGPFAGTMALAAHTTGVLGRLFADALENSSPLPEQSLRDNGVAPFAAFLYSTLPQALPQIVSYTLYRWENNIRAAAILGVVGAGGLGQMLKYHLSLFQMHQAATVIIAMLALVAGVDATSFWLRRMLTR